jgi:hypothetical protein
MMGLRSSLHLDSLKFADWIPTKVLAVHIQAPGYEACIAQLADRVITQRQYQHEVLDWD